GLLPGGDYTFDLRADSALSFTVRQTVSGHTAIVRVVLRGVGRHRIAVRGDGIDFGETEKTGEAEKTVKLQKGIERIVEFKGRLTPSGPWVAMVAPDADWLHGKEVILSVF
ncbi:MAG TPA: hypothetical protein VHW43_01405, partial [Puia sp.]|nr:hypothetical protein [Puia sp.]